jgi:aquaporin rerated protein, other eukaryote
MTSYFSTIQDDAQAALLEFIGTTFFLLLGLGGIQAATGEAITSSGGSTIEQVLYISTCMGLSLLVSAWLFFRVTGGLFNPNISLALLLVGVIKPVRFVLYCIAQMLGAIAASGLILALTPGPLSVKLVVKSSFIKMAPDDYFCSTFLQQGTNSAQGVFIEMFITTALVLAVLMLAAEKHQATPFAPVRLTFISSALKNANLVYVPTDRHRPYAVCVASVGRISRGWKSNVLIVP